MDFDPIAIERHMVGAGVLDQRADSKDGPLGADEALFSEYDDRKYALWRISMVRQFQPSTLGQLSDDDLLYLAGQTPEGYPDYVTAGIDLYRNKVMQNAERARVELDTRARRATWRRSVALVLGGAVLGALLPWIGSNF